MSVPLTVLRLEIPDDSRVLDFNYKIEREEEEIVNQDDNKDYEPKQQPVTNQQPATKPQPVTNPESLRGRRKFSTITIETYMATSKQGTSSLFDSVHNESTCRDDIDTTNTVKKRTLRVKSESVDIGSVGSRTFAEVTQSGPSSCLHDTTEAGSVEREHTISGALKQQLHRSHSIDYNECSPRGNKPSPRGKSPSNTERAFTPINLDLEDRACFTPVNLDLEEARSRSAAKAQSPIPESLTFFSGNPSVESTEGIIHLYKENKLTALDDESIKRGELICMLNVPTTLTSQDLIQLIAPVEHWVEHIKIIRDATPNHYMVLVKFRSQKNADDFYKTFNGKPYNSIEPEVCYLVYVAKLEAIKSSNGAGFPIPGVTELPTCPVCLERMDESVNGILTILCNHSFHASCLAHWDDTSCPVCRYTQTPESVADNTCFECAAQDSLWICLICGYVGCGRYVQGHAFRHFQETNHTYSMQLGNNRVWDYAGDNYVHRLVQNKSDGKMVQVGEDGTPTEGEDKIDAITLEYTYLLNTQLESQRHYFEAKLALVEKQAIQQIGETEQHARQTAEKCHQMETLLVTAQKERNTLDKKYTEVASRFSKTLRLLNDEQEMNKFLRENQAGWQKQVDELKEVVIEKDGELCDTREQLRDVMMHFGAQQQLSSTNQISQQEIEGSHVSVGATNVRRSRKKAR